MSMLCGQKRTGPKFTLVMEASLMYLGQMGIIMVGIKLGKDCVKKSMRGGESVIVDWGIFSAAGVQFLLYSYMAG